MFWSSDAPFSVALHGIARGSSTQYSAEELPDVFWKGFCSRNVTILLRPFFPISFSTIRSELLPSFVVVLVFLRVYRIMSPVSYLFSEEISHVG